MCGGDDNSAVPESREVVGFKKPPKSKQFKPGESGNPGGRPKKDWAAVIAVRAHEIIVGEHIPTESTLDKNAVMLADAIIKNPKMAQVTADRGFGKVPQTLNLTGEISVSNTVADRLRAARKRVKS